MRGHLSATVTLVAPLDIIRPRHCVDAFSAAAFFGSEEDRHQAVRLRVRQRAQEHAVDHAEDCGGCADAQSEHQNHDRAEGGPLEQHSYAVTKVLEHFVLQSSRLQPERIPKSAETAAEQIKFGAPNQLVPIGEHQLAILQLGLPLLLPIRAQPARYNHAEDADQPEMWL